MTTIRLAVSVLLVLHIAHGQSALRDVRRIYIGEIAGNIEKIAHERLNALLTNTNGRFVVTEEKDKADAVLTGVAVEKSGFSFGATPAMARGGTFTQVDLVLRLVGKNSETIWAFDGAKGRCYSAPVTGCAIDQLVKDAKKKTK
jgi:hypothetical protein